MSAARIPPGSRRDIGLVAWVIASISGRVAGTPPPNLFTTLGRHRRLFLGWVHFGGRLMPGGKLPRRETELVILRVAHLRDCRYEFDHHERLARRAKISADEIERVKVGPHGGWSARGTAILEAVDMLVRDHTLDDATWGVLRTHLAERELIELILLVGHYEMLATTIAALRIEPDVPT